MADNVAEGGNQDEFIPNYDETVWRSVSLTHVEYPKGNFLLV